MAVLTGIQALQMGDGASGKAALSIKTRVLRILADSKLSYMLATMMNANDVKAGTVSYYVPEIIGSNDYGAAGAGAFNAPNSGIVSVNINTRRDVKWEWETFDISRLEEGDYILGMITTGIAMAVLADLNGQFLQFLANKFDKTSGEEPMKTNKIPLTYLTKENVNETPENMRKDLLSIEYKMNKINQLFDKGKLGVPKAEIMAVVAPVIDTNMKYAFWNQPNSLGNWVISKTLEGHQIGNLKYMVDPMLNNNIPAGSSFNNDQAQDFTKFYGILFHNEAIAMPINVNEVIALRNPDNGNPRFITKYQFGIGVIRPKLVYQIVDAADVRAKDLKDK